MGSNCVLKRKHELRQRQAMAKASWWIRYQPQIQNLFIYMFVGTLTGLTAFVIDIAIEFFARQKYEIFTSWFKKENREDKNALEKVSVVLFVSSINAIICLIAAIFGVLVPVSTGSGIPHIKCYLNGTKIDFLLRLKTYFAKVIGVVLSVVGGMPVGN